MKRFQYFVPAFALALLAFSCKPELEEIPSNLNADLNLNKYVAFGDYLTAGYTNGSLNPEGQNNAYPHILAEQFARTISVPGFVEPILNDPKLQPLQFTGFNADGTPAITESVEMDRLLFSACSNPSAGPYAQFSTDAAQTAAIQNFGVPGLKVSQIRQAGLGNEANLGTPANFNPFFERLLPPNDNRTYQAVAGSTRPTFFTLWVGMSDIVSYAMSGASCGSIPNTSDFKMEVSSLLDTLSKVTKQPDNKLLSTRKGILCNIPNLRDLPMFLNSEAVTLESKYRSTLNDPGLNIWINRKIGPFIPAYNAQKVSFTDFILPKGVKNLNRRDPNLDTRVVNGVSMVVPHGLSEHNPLENDEVLDGSEVSEIETQIADYNLELERLLYNDLARVNTAYSNMVILANMKELFSSFKRGIIYNGVQYSALAVKGGIFSLDNFTLTPRGQAFVANTLIQTMNREINPKNPKGTGFGTKIKEVNVNDYPGVKYP